MSQTNLQHPTPGKTSEDENDESSQPITTPEEVPESNDEKIDQDFPGYPHYPAKDDILNPENHTEKVDVDVENLSSENGTDVRLQEQPSNSTDQFTNTNANSTGEEDEIGIVAGTDADVTAEDLLLLGEKDQDMDLGEDEEIKRVSSLLDLTDDELDVPGSELDDENELIGEEDEENNYYSLGGDNHENLEESRG